VVKLRIVCLAALLLWLGVACGSNGNGAAAPTSTQRSLAVQTVAPSGPSLSVEPRDGPPGTLVTVTGAGWPARAAIAIVAANAASAAQPYATATAGDDGVFTTRFRLEKAPDGSDLKIGRFDLRAQAASVQATVAFEVDTPRPVRDPSSGS